jgi:dTDP-4-dehydrorhamnose reductase
MTNILVLGITGMLGKMVFEYLSRNPEFSVFGTVRNDKYLSERIFFFNANDISHLEKQQFTDLGIDYIINCIGITKPFIKDSDPEEVIRAIKINVNFPWKLAKYAKKHDIKVLQIGTDCVYSGKKGSYKEDDPHDPLDVYGKSKSLGEVFDGSTLIIRSSIIGPEFKEDTKFLLEWFISQPKGGTIGGYEHHIWNGVTTLQFAEICEKIIQSNSFNKLIEISYVHHFIPNNTVNKFELMNLFNEIYKKELEINRVNIPDQKIDRSLGSNYTELEKLFGKADLKSTLLDLKNYNERKLGND